MKYFKPTKVLIMLILPLPSGPLSEVMPLSSMEAANREVKSIIHIPYYNVGFTNSYSEQIVRIT